ncbi:flagellar motor protein MotB [Terricaulis sp.]|uniref:flagellar motor protein MotB n=1 Tax=Terricaulis sp. TaxID=2768686 RepID=UPI0037843D9A
MVAATNQRPILIKKVKKVVGGGHHGGAWKVAYADFVTAMMAFFLLMWLINTTSPEQRRGIAEFFAPASVSRVSSGAGGLLEGTSFAESGVRHGHSAPVASSSEPQFTSNASAENQAQQNTEAAGQNSPNEDALTRARTMRETAEFNRAEIAIRQAMQDMPDVAELSRNVIVEQTPEGLRIQIVDQEGRSMFSPGDARPNERAQRLLVSISGVISQLPNRITISGHTDGSPPGGRYASNFELSAARANEARRILMANGIPSERVYQVAGRADSEPLFADDPTLPGNRRIAITLLREAPPLPADHDL